MTVTRCEKGPKSDTVQRAAAAVAYADLNADHIADWAVRGGAKGGRHLVGETKCYDPLVSYSAGSGSKGGMAMTGATRPLGNTEEGLIKANYGLAERGVGDHRFDHRTGVGHVAACKGAYHDCIHVKKNTLMLLISETFGGVNGRGIRFLTRLAHTARQMSDVAYADHTGRSVSYFHHHACAISCAAAFGHGKVVGKIVDDVRVRAIRLRGGAVANGGVAPVPAPAPAPVPVLVGA